jgi:DNA polymerase-3 subunit alpha
VAQIITFGDAQGAGGGQGRRPRAGAGASNEANKLTKLMPTELKMTIDKALDQEPELKKMYNEDERFGTVIDISRKLEGLARNAGIHAAGVVVADKPLDQLPAAVQVGQ